MKPTRLHLPRWLSRQQTPQTPQLHNTPSHDPTPKGQHTAMPTETAETTEPLTPDLLAARHIDAIRDGNGRLPYVVRGWFRTLDGRGRWHLIPKHVILHDLRATAHALTDDELSEEDLDRAFQRLLHTLPDEYPPINARAYCLPREHPKGPPATWATRGPQDTVPEPGAVRDLAELFVAEAAYRLDGRHPGRIVVFSGGSVWLWIDGQWQVAAGTDHWLKAHIRDWLAGAVYLKPPANAPHVLTPDEGYTWPRSAGVVTDWPVNGIGAPAMDARLAAAIRDVLWIPHLPANPSAAADYDLRRAIAEVQAADRSSHNELSPHAMLDL